MISKFETLHQLIESNNPWEIFPDCVLPPDSVLLFQRRTALPNPYPAHHLNSADGINLTLYVIFLRASSQVSFSPCISIRGFCKSRPTSGLSLMNRYLKFAYKNSFDNLRSFGRVIHISFSVEIFGRALFCSFKIKLLFSLPLDIFHK